MQKQTTGDITDVIGKLQYRLALTGGWIDQPFMSKLNPDPPGSMVVVAVEPQFPWMDRAGMCGSTRSIALDLWPDGIPDEDPAKLVQILYEKENGDNPEPSGSQDMIGLIYPGISRLDYDYEHEGGYFPVHIESRQESELAHWLESVIHIVPYNIRPPGYNPLGRKNLDREWVRRLGQSGKDCFNAIIQKNLEGLGSSFNECMECWHTLLPDILEHETLKADIIPILEYYQQNYVGAMYSGCGGGYIYVASEDSVPGSFQIKVRVAGK